MQFPFRKNLLLRKDTRPSRLGWIFAQKLIFTKRCANVMAIGPAQARAGPPFEGLRVLPSWVFSRGRCLADSPGLARPWCCGFCLRVFARLRARLARLRPRLGVAVGPLRGRSAARPRFLSPSSVSRARFRSRARGPVCYGVSSRGAAGSVWRAGFRWRAPGRLSRPGPACGAFAALSGVPLTSGQRFELCAPGAGSEGGHKIPRQPGYPHPVHWCVP